LNNKDTRFVIIDENMAVTLINESRTPRATNKDQWLFDVDVGCRAYYPSKRISSLGKNAEVTYIYRWSHVQALHVPDNIKNIIKLLDL